MLFGGDLTQFDGPLSWPDNPVLLEPGATHTVVLLFPFPEDVHDELDLEGLNLRWTMETDGLADQYSLAFRRRPQPRRTIHYGIGIGWGSSHHHHGWSGGGKHLSH